MSAQIIFIITQPTAEFIKKDVVTRMTMRFSISPVICQVAVADQQLERFIQKGHTTRNAANRKKKFSDMKIT